MHAHIKMRETEVFGQSLNVELLNRAPIRPISYCPVAFMPKGTNTVELLGFPILTGSHEDVIRQLRERCAAGLQTQVLTLNPEMIMAARVDQSVFALLREADVVVADGIGVEFAARLLGIRTVQRYPGVDLAVDLARAMPDQAIFLLGSRPGVAENAAAGLRTIVPHVNITGCLDGYFGNAEDHAVARQVAHSGAGILLVGMGSPRQEQFIAAARHECGAMLLIGVGGSFEVYAGIKHRAPGWVRALGLEWLHRITQDGSRLHRLACLPGYVKLVLREYIGKLNDQVC